MDRFTLEIKGVSEALRVAAFRAEERISRPYRADVYVLTKQSAFAGLEGALSKRATFTIAAADHDAATKMHGIVTAVELVHAFGDRALVAVEIRPKLWLLALERHSRVWVKKKALDVVKELFSKSALDAPVLAAQATYPELEHVCQYHESDLAFVSRWLERDGLHYWFEPGDDAEKLHIADANPSERHPRAALRCVGGLDAGQAASVGQALFRFAARRTARTSETTVGDYYYPQPSLEIRASHATLHPSEGKSVAFRERVWAPAEATRLAQVRAEEAAAEAVLFEGEGTVLGLRCGFVFEVGEHHGGGPTGEYRCVALRHRGFDASHGHELARWIDPELGWLRTDAPPYHVDLEAVVADVPYRPARSTPWPALSGLEYARIDGEADGDYAQLDNQGRYVVKLMFDENSSPAGGASTRLRLLQPHGGNPEGCHFPLRKGTEVLVGFVDGDPDRPVVVGAVPNPETPSTVTSANATQNVIQTGGKNRIEVEDKSGSEYVVLYSPPDKSTLHLGAANGPFADGHHARISTDGDAKVHAGGSRHITIGGEQTEDVKGPVGEAYHANQTTHVYGAWKETIDGSATQTISAGETRTVSGGLTETINGGETRTITGSQTETVSASATRTIGASLQEMVGASVTRTISANETTTVGANLSQVVAGGVTIDTPGALTVTTAAAATFIAPAGFTLVAPGGFHNFDGEWLKTGLTSFGKIFAITDSIVAIKSDILGAWLSVVIMRNFLGSLKVGFLATKFGAHGEHDENAAVDTYGGGALICPAANHTEA